MTASASEADGALCAADGMRAFFLTKPATVFSLDVALRAAVNDVSGDLASLALADLLDEDTLAALAELDQRAPPPFLGKLIDRFLDGLPEQVASIHRACARDRAFAPIKPCVRWKVLSTMNTSTDVCLIRVVVADDHPIVRAGMCGILSSDRGLTLVGDAEDGQQAVKMVRKGGIDVLVLDLAMPGR